MRRLAIAWRSWRLVFLYLEQSIFAWTSCLPDAIPASQRINLTNSDGQSYPLGIDIGVVTNGVQRGTSAILSILLEEIYGFNLVDFQSTDGALAAAALAGCSRPEVIRQQPELACLVTEEPRMHVSLAVFGQPSVWWDYFRSTAPVGAGGMGYETVTGIFFPKAIADEAYEESGISLVAYQSWNASWHDPAKYFDPIGVINVSQLTPCPESQMGNARIMAEYVAISQDYEGLHPNGTAICEDGYWFLTPACRSNASRCVPVTVGPQPRPLVMTLQRAASFSMPLAVNQLIEESNGVNGVDLALSHKMAFFGADPPRTSELVPLQPVFIEFPKYDEVAWSRADYRTLLRSSDVTGKFVSWNLKQMAPRVVDLVERVRFPNSVIDTIFQSAASGAEWRDVACEWLLSNQDVWTEWIPDETVCLPGFGLYNSSTLQFAENRQQETDLTCIPCASGRYSMEIFDRKGVTYICAPCPSGSYQQSGAALRCELCPAGEYQDREEGKSCKRCSLGLYQDQLGMTACKNCSEGTTTVGLASQSQLDCGCTEGHIETARNQSTNLPTCQVCQAGLNCPKFSTQRSLMSGTSELGEEFLPQLRAGFMALQEQPLEVYRCRSSEECPGGTPGTCTGGRSSIACSLCGADEYWSDEQCQTCQTWIRGLWIAILVVGFAFLPFCRFSQMKIDSPTCSTLAFTILCIVEIWLNLLQSIGIISQMPLEWPVSLAWSFAFLELFAFEISDFGFTCLVGPNPLVQYGAQAAFLPSLLIWVMGVHVILKSVGGRSQRIRRATLWGPHLVLVMGQIVMMCFEALSNLSLMPWMCYKHPNGSHSNLQFASILCGAEDHVIMSWLGAALCCLVLGFLSSCAWALFKLPRWSMEGRDFGVIATQFMTDQFRPDSWWFGLLVLLRGPVLSLLITVFTNEPKSQIMLITMALITYLVTLLLAWPFKIPLLNALEAACSWSVLILVLGGSLYLPASDSEAMDFSAISTLLSLLVAMALIAASLILSTAYAIGFCIKRKERRFFMFDLGRLPVHNELAQLLTQSATGISRLNHEILEERLQSLSPFDSRLVLHCISMLNLEVLPLESESRWLKSSSRLSSRSMSSLRQSNSMSPAAMSPSSPRSLSGRSLSRLNSDEAIVQSIAVNCVDEEISMPSVSDWPEHADPAEPMEERYL